MIKRFLSKKITPILLATVMLFAVFGFGGASCSLTLQQRLDNVGSQVYVVLNDDYALFVDIDTLLEELAELHDEILQLEGEYELMLERIDSYMAQLRALRTELEQPREIPFEIHFFDISGLGSERSETPLHVIDDFTNLYTVIYDTPPLVIRTCPASDFIIESYDEKFFIDSILVVVSVGAPNAVMWIYASYIILQKGAIDIQLHIRSMSGGSISNGVVLIELSRADIRNASILKAFIHRPMLNLGPQLVGPVNI